MTFTAAEDLKTLLGENIIGGLEVTDKGVLDISWKEGQVFDVSADLVKNVVANAGTTLTDDDTNYLKWKTGATLAVELTEATGNEVAIADIVCSGVDIDSITEHGFDFSAVAGLEGRPVIRLEGDKEPDFRKNYGRILIGAESLPRSDRFVSYRNEFYRILMSLELDEGTGPALLKRMLAQVKSVFLSNFDKIDHVYDYELLYQWDGLYTLGFIEIFVEAVKEKVSGI